MNLYVHIVSDTVLQACTPVAFTLPSGLTPIEPVYVNGGAIMYLEGGSTA